MKLFLFALIYAALFMLAAAPSRPPAARPARAAKRDGFSIYYPAHRSRP